MTDLEIAERLRYGRPLYIAGSGKPREYHELHYPDGMTIGGYPRDIVVGECEDLGQTRAGYRWSVSSTIGDGWTEYDCIEYSAEFRKVELKPELPKKQPPKPNPFYEKGTPLS